MWKSRNCNDDSVTLYILFICLKNMFFTSLMLTEELDVLGTYEQLYVI